MIDIRFAAIDIGSNSTNLLVTDASGETIERIVRSTRLGEGTTSTGLLSVAAIDRTVSCIAEYAELIKRHHVTHQRVVATAACRLANNTPEFFAKVKDATSIEPQLITAEQEGDLAFRGATSHLGGTESQLSLVIDIGGASTELMIGGKTPTTVVSLAYGAVTISENELHRDPPRPEELTNAISLVSDAVDDVAHNYPEIGQVDRVIGVAGTIVTVAAIELGLKVFDPKKLHQMVLSRKAVEDVFRTLATESLHNRVFNPGLPRDRADIIVGGCCVLVAVMRRLQISEMIVSQHNLLDGIIDGIIESLRNQHQ